jgi:hypothetical protein
MLLQLKVSRLETDAISLKLKQIGQFDSLNFIPTIRPFRVKTSNFWEIVKIFRARNI